MMYRQDDDDDDDGTPGILLEGCVDGETKASAELLRLPSIMLKKSQDRVIYTAGNIFIVVVFFYCVVY
jgi:hypothetical protein